jgi:hypothetical protein
MPVPKCCAKAFMGLFLMLFILPLTARDGDQTPLKAFLNGLRSSGVEKLECSGPYTEKYLLYVDQPVDHNDPASPGFQQRVFVMLRNRHAPVVFTTEGYAADYAEYPAYSSELSGYLQANEVVVEHRYFGASVPVDPEWKHLTVAAAAADHHRVIEMLKPFFDGKWVSTGISKGGQTAMFHRAFYPDDVDATVGYVCPLNFSIEDRRCYTFLQEVGSSECRDRIHRFQEMLLCNKDWYFEAFRERAEMAGKHYSIGDTAAYELTALEYSFAFWQWGLMPCDSIPGAEASPVEVIAHLDQVAGLDWVSDEGIEGFRPFFYQALTEIGFYGYNLAAFEGCIEALDDPTFMFTCPPETDCIYEPATMEKVDNFVRHHGSNMLFIYGEYDPWSAPAVQISGKTNAFNLVKPGGSHLTRIGNLPEELRRQVLETLAGWLDCEINP